MSKLFTEHYALLLLAYLALLAGQIIFWILAIKRQKDWLWLATLALCVFSVVFAVSAPYGGGGFFGHFTDPSPHWETSCAATLVYGICFIGAFVKRAFFMESMHHGKIWKCAFIIFAFGCLLYKPVILMLQQL